MNSPADDNQSVHISQPVASLQVNDIECTLSICCFPRRLEENSILETLYEPLERIGVRLIPYDWIFSTFRKVDVFHVHWPDAIVMGRSLLRAWIKFFAFFLSVSIYRARGTKIVYQVHNLGAHDGHFPKIEALVWKLFLPAVDCFVHMNSNSVTEFKRAWPQTADLRHEVVFLPHYGSSSHVATDERQALRCRFGLSSSSHVFLAFGLLRPYKGIEDLINAFAAMKDHGKAELVIAGRAFSPDYGQEIGRLCDAAERVHFIEGFLPDEELEALLAACDTVVLAYRKVNNSSTVLKALSAGRRVLAPSLGALPEVADLVGRDWVLLFETLTPDVLDEALSRPFAKDGGPDLSQFEPATVSAHLGSILASLKLDDR